MIKHDIDPSWCREHPEEAAALLQHQAERLDAVEDEKCEVAVYWASKGINAVGDSVERLVGAELPNTILVDAAGNMNMEEHFTRPQIDAAKAVVMGAIAKGHNAGGNGHA